MNDSRFELKVGLFVAVGAALIALLILNFTKGATFGKTTYSVRVILPNAAGLKVTADVMMAGVAIGKVSTLELADDTKSVNITVSILSRYKIRKDAIFHIDSLGFLGDQYVSVSAAPDTGLAPTNEVKYLQNGDTVKGEPVFNMTEAVQSISGVVDQAKRTIRDLDQAITNVNNTVLSPATLGRVSGVVSNMQILSERASGAVLRADRMLQTNETAIHTALDNFSTMSATLTNTAGNLDEIVSTNRGQIDAMVSNLTATSENFKKFSEELENGHGLISSLINNQQMTTNVTSILTNVDALSFELNTFASNLNQKGIWSMLWKPKSKKDAEAHSAAAPAHRR